MITRRGFNKNMLLAIASSGFGAIACTDKNLKSKQKLGVALVGLGSYSQYQLGPALLETEFCQLKGIVTGTPEKAKIWSKKYNIDQKNIYSYQNFNAIKENKEIDIVYVVLPNSMHAEYSIRAAEAGKHVICEKPMALNVAECDEIIDTCARAGVKLSVGYRLHSEPYTQEVKRIVAEKHYGDLRYVAADAGYFSDTHPNQWRLNKKLSGGGALMNMGVYSIQSCIYGSGQNPISVMAQEFSTRAEYFKETDETITAQFEFSNGAVGNMMTSHNISANRMYSNFENGWVELSPANSYGPLEGNTSDGRKIKFEHRSQQALQMDDFAKHILFASQNVAPGEMGKRDMIIVESIYKSIAEGGAKQKLELGMMGIVG